MIYLLNVVISLLKGRTEEYRILMDQFHHVSTAFLELNGRSHLHIFNYCLLLSILHFHPEPKVFNYSAVIRRQSRILP